MSTNVLLMSTNDVILNYTDCLPVDLPTWKHQSSEWTLVFQHGHLHAAYYKSIQYCTSPPSPPS